jgi:hypothetical protein
MNETASRTINVPSSGRDANGRLDAAARTLPRRRFFSDMPDKGLFALVALVGFGGIMLLKTYNVFSSDFIAALAVATMVAYGVLSFQMPAVQLRPDRLGDNFYYLGFIYTLASLSASLLQLRTTSHNMEDLLGNFGIALVTTVVGVAGRVLFVQMRGEIDDVEERVRRDLVTASSDLRAQLVISLREFETFHTGVVQASHETVKKASAQAEMQIEQIGKVAEAAIEKLNILTTANDTRTQKLAGTLKKINEAMSELPGAVESLVVELRNPELQNTLSKARKRRRWYWPFRSRN